MSGQFISGIVSYLGDSICPFSFAFRINSSLILLFFSFSSLLCFFSYLFCICSLSFFFSSYLFYFAFFPFLLPFFLSRTRNNSTRTLCLSVGPWVRPRARDARINECKNTHFFLCVWVCLIVFAHNNVVSPHYLFHYLTSFFHPSRVTLYAHKWKSHE